MLKVFAFDKLMVVAHPDDEIIFGGAQLVKEYGWKVVCATNLKEPIRSAEFFGVMKKSACLYEMWDYLDRSDVIFPQEKLEADLRRVLSERCYKTIVTHAANGEYGHPHHIQLHQTIASLTNDFYVFGVGDVLPNDVWIKKLKLMTIYQSQKKMCKSLLWKSRRECLQKYRPV